MFRKVWSYKYVYLFIDLSAAALARLACQGCLYCLFSFLCLFECCFSVFSLSVCLLSVSYFRCRILSVCYCLCSEPPPHPTRPPTSPPWILRVSRFGVIFQHCFLHVFGPSFSRCWLHVRTVFHYSDITFWSIVFASFW